MFEEAIAANKRRSHVLVASFFGIVMLLGVAVNYLLGGGSIGVIVIAVVATAATWISYWNSDKIALASCRAVPADPVTYARLHNLVEGLCIAGGLPKPRVYVVDDPAPNAFATGRNPEKAAIAVTTGLLETMNRVELEGVLAHELSHVRNYDTLVMTIAVTMVGITVIVSDLALRFSFFGGRSRSDNNGNSPAHAVILVLSFVFIVLTPLFAKLLQYSISRKRESLADASAVALTRYPPGLISALEKLRDNSTVVSHGTRAAAHLWIESPLEAAPGNAGYSKMNKLFSTHPPIDERIAALKEM